MISRAQATARHQAEARLLNERITAARAEFTEARRAEAEATSERLAWWIGDRKETLPFFLAIAATIVGMTLCNIFDAPLLWWLGVAFGPAMLAGAWATDRDFAEGNGYCDEEPKP